MSRAKGSIARVYSETEIHTALLTVAYNNGSASRASEQLDIPERTLRSWKHKKAELYASIRSDLLPKIAAEAAERHTRLAEKHLDANEDALKLLHDRIPELDDKNLIQAINHTGVQSGIHRDKAAMLQGQVVDKPDLPDINSILLGLKNAGVTNVNLNLVDDEAEVSPLPIEGSAEEIPDGTD